MIMNAEDLNVTVIKPANGFAPIDLAGHGFCCAFDH